MPGTARGRLVIRASLRGAGRLAGAFLLAAGAVLSVSPAFAQPAAPTGFEVAQAGSIKAKLAWNAPAASAGIVRHEVRFRAGSAEFPDTWTDIPSSRPGQANAAAYLLAGLTAETDYDFELRAVSGDGDGAAASASATTLPPFTARFSPLKTYYEGTQFTMTIVFTAAIDKPTLEKGVQVQNGRIAVRAERGQPETWHISATSTRRRDVTFFLFVATDCDTQGGFPPLCSTLGEPLTAELTATVPHIPSVTLALSLATISEDSGVTTVTASLDKKWHEDVTVAVSASPVTPATASDFNLSSTTTLTIASGRTSTGTVTVTAVDNDAQAADRQVTVSGEVTAPDYVPDPDAVTLTIRDDEAAAPAPTGFAVSAGSTKAELSWDQTPKGVVVTAHEVRYRAGADAFPATWTAIPDSAPGEANATGHTVTALSPGTDYDFELRVVNDNGSSSAATASATTRAAFTARFETIPDTHDRTPFTVRIRFSAAIASTGVLGQGVQLTGGDNTAVRGGNDLFDYDVTPSGVGAVTITLPVASGCGSNGAICNTFDEPLSAELTGTVTFFGVPPSGKLVGNVTKTLDTGTLPTSPATSFVYAQSFTTGANETGYKLDRIGIHLTQVDPGDLAAVSLLSADADGEPDAELYPLTGPLALQTGAMNYFSAPPGALLTKETTYYLQVTGAGRSEFRVRIVGGTDETEEDADSAADWLVGDDLRERTSTTDWITTPKVMKIRVDGHVLGTFPTVFLGLAPPAVAESGAATVTAAALPASDTAFTVTVTASPVSPATASDFSLSANATLDFDANETASTGAVTITAADDTVETADREVTVSGSVSATGIAGPDDVTLTILDDDAELFTAEFSEIPETHDGQTAFTVKIRFSADIASAETLADGVELTGGAAGSITRVGSGADHWNYPVTPAGDDDVYITLPVPSGCAGTGDICSADDVRLATALVGRVAGPVSQDPPDGGDPPDDGTPTAPAAPTGFGVDSLDGAVRLLWRAPLSDGGSEITHHQYRERIDNPKDIGDQWLGWSTWKTIPDSTPGGQNGESFTVTELENGRLYQFELRAVNANGSTRSQPPQVGGFPDAGELPTDLSLTPSPPDPAPAVFSRAEYTVKFTGAWTLAVTPDGLPSDAHFSRLVGGVHNGAVVFVQDGRPASDAIESLAEVGGTELLKAEISAAGDDSLSVLEGTATLIDRAASESFTEVALTTDHPRVTLVTMVAPTPDWFVGVSGLSMLDSLGGWRASRTVYLHPFDAGTEDGAGFSLNNDATDPPVYIASLVGVGKFSAEPIATLTFTRTSVASAPAAPADLAATPGDASVALAWTTGADGGSAIRMHQYRYRTGAAYPAAWTDIPDSAAGGANVSGFTVGGLTNGASHSFQVRARNDVGAGPAATSGAATPMPTVVVNAAPAFDSAATFNPNENQTAAGTVVASDGDTEDDIEGYAIVGGADQGKFSIHSISGALTFDSAPNFEDPDDANTDGRYQVTVRATSGTGTRVKTATQTITVTVTDVSGEAPGKPDAPDVSAASVTSLNVNWSAPANAGPAITDYDVQYRAGTSGGWTDRGHSGTATTATITGLAEGTSHQVQVRATNDEGTGSWSDSGTGATDANAAGVTVSATALTVTEQDTAGDSYTVVLDTEPTHAVTVTVGGHAGTDVSLSASTLTFTPSNWDQAQTVTVTALNDDDTANDAVALTHAATSTDGNYSGITIAGVAVTVTDNDTTTPAVTLALSAGSIGENGGVSTVTATVSPASAAAFTVTISAAAVSPAVAADFRLSANPVLSFAENATTSTGSVTITGVDDDVDAADKTVTVSGTVSATSVTAPANRTLTLNDDDLPVVTIARDKNVVNEDEGDAGFTLTRVGLTAATLAVTVEVTQQADRDLLPDGAEAMRTVTFAAGSATAALAVALENDNLQEVLGGVTVEVQPGTAYTVGAPASATVTVVDTDNTTATPANLVASPGTGPGEVVLSWNAHALHARFVRHQYRYKTDGGYEGWTDIPNSGQHDTPTGEDGSNLTGYTVTGLVGGQAHTFEVRTVGLFSKTSDSSNEDSATPRSAAVSFEAATYSVDEGATVEVTVSLSGAPGREVTVTVSATAAGGATAQGETGADWSGVPENVTFGATDTEQSFTLAATQDMVDDDSEGVVLSFGTLPDGVTAGTLSGATVTIVDDDAAGVTVSATALTVTEQDTTGDSYTVVLDTEPTHEVTVTVGGHAGTDVSLSASTLTFTPSNWDRAQTVTVTARNDDDTANDAVTLTHAATSTDGNYSGIAIAGVAVTVTDNDTTTPAVTLALSAGSIGENGGVSTVTATVSPASAAAFTVTVAAAAVSPAVAADFRLSANQVLSFAENATTSTGSVTITGVDNDVDAADKTVTVSGTVSATGVTAPANLTLTLEDDDAAPTVTVADAAATEGDKVEFVVTLSAVSGRDVTVDYATSVATGDDATSGTDFTAASGMLEIEAGNRTGTIEVQTTEDDASESAETFTLTIANPDNATLGAKVAATGTINDDDANAAPTFSSSATFDAAENQTAAGTVLAADSDSGDDITGYAITGGADQALFEIGATSGALTFKTAPNFEDAKDSDTDNDYVVEVQATSGTDTREKTATQTITVTVTDVSGEAPGKPDAPTVAAASVTSLTVTWTAPANAGPAITDYDYRHRTTSPQGTWTEVTGTTITTLSATIGSLEENTSYDVQVRATNDEGTGDWSDSGSGTTDANAAPSFSSSAAFDAAENQTAAGTVVAADSDTGDDITGYAITGGADQALFEIGATSGALTFKTAPNFEDAEDQGTDNTYVVTVQATSGTDSRVKTATQAITVTVTNVSGEAPGKPDAPNVSAASVTSLTVNWSAPANAGPAITDYDVQYREGTSGSWSDGNHTGTAVTATLSSLSENTSHQVQVRATSDEGTGVWSDSGSGTTDANAAPAFSSSATFDAAENQTAAGTVLASDNDTGDAVTGYEITGGADQSFFSIGSTSGLLTFNSAPNFEAPSDTNADGSYLVTVQATSGTDSRVKTATQTITVTVTNVSGEAPGKPDAPNVSAASASSLSVTWSAPANAGPAITDYDVQYREGTSGSWSDGGHAGAATTATLSGLSENTSYQVQVQATNDEGTGSWSDSGTGTTDANAAPTFSSSATFDAAENQTAAGTVVAADSDTGDDITGYAITGGADQALFEIGATSGALTFKTAPNFEDAEDQGTDNTYVVTVQATSGTDSRVKTATQAITVTVTNVSGEAPGKPDAPNVSAASVTSLTVSWSAPDNAGPAITDYDYRHRTTSPVGNWTEVTDTTSTALSATIGSLAETTSYDVQVRATNAEGTGDWSASGTGSTASNAAPAFDSAATFTPAENQTTVGTVVASDGDTEDDIEDYAITGGADQGKFSIHATSGALTFKAAPNYEDPDDADADGSYLVTVQATSGTGTREKTATADIRVTLQNVIELFTQLTGPSSTDYAENGAVRVATYIASSEADRDGIAWNLGGDEVEHFSIDNPAGVLRFDIDPVDPSPFPQPPDFEAPVDDDDDGVYELIVLAQAGSDLTLKTVIVTVTDENEAGAISLDTARPKMGDPPTATLTDPDGVTAGTVTWQWERSAGRNAWVVIDGAAAASYTPTAADTGAYLRVTATYTDSHAADQTAQAVSAEVVTAELLGSLAVTTNASTANPDRWAMRPEFSADILHYAVGCTATDPGDTMTLAFAAANAGTRVAVNGEQADDRKATVEVPVEGDSEVRITLATGSTGVHTTYVVHCMDSRNPAIERTIKEPGASTELISISAQDEPTRDTVRATYLAIIDANGVPRWQQRLPESRTVHFKVHPDGKYPYSYGEAPEIVILDENLVVVERVTTTDDLQHTGTHDFVIRENGNYVFEAYEPATRDFSAYTDEDDNPYGTSEDTSDSVIEEVTPDGERVFFWNSWDHMYLNDCLQHRFPIDYAHINSVQVVDEADIIASFRGCSQVWRIDRETQAGEWLLGRSNRSDAEWERKGIRMLKIVGDPHGEFCGQHSARLIPNGHLLLFDNGNQCLEDPETGETQRPNSVFSRVVEYALDPDNGEAAFVRQHCSGNTCDRVSRSQGHIHRMDSGHWLISWGRGESSRVSDASVTEVDPLTNEELLAFKITHPDYYAGPDEAGTTRAYPVEFVALADTPGPLRAEIAESSATSVSHLGPTDAPKVVVSFNQPVVDPDPAATTWPWVSVQGATVTSVSAHTVPGDPANAYLFTLTPAGVGPITFAPVAGQSCASGGICTAAGTVLSVVPATAHTIAWVDTVAPVLAAANGAAVNGATLTLTFDEALASANTAASAFAVTGGTTRTISGVSVNGSTVQLTIDPPVLYGESGIEVDYTAPSREALADAAGNEVASFEDRAVSNETPATTLSTGVSLSLDTASVSEGGSAKSVALTAMLNRSARPAATAVTVEVGTTGDTATEGTDYAAVDDLTLTIPAYSTSGTARFTLTPTNDRIDEPDESLTVRGSTTASGLIVTPSGGLSIGLSDNDPAPSLGLSTDKPSFAEDGGTTTVTVSTGSGSTFATAQTVRLSLAGTATETTDYTISGKTLTLPAGAGTTASMVTATLTGVDDDLDDDGETVVVSGTHNGVAFGDRRTVTVEDDDDPEVTVSFAQAGYRAAEGGHVDVAVTLSAVPERQVSIPVEAEGADGADSADFSISPSSLSFGANETTRTVRVSAANDSVVDPGESVALSLGTPLPERISEGGIAETTVAIRDTDFTFAPAFAAGAGTTESDADTYTVSEASSALRLSLRLETPRGARVVDIANPVVVSLATRENAGSRETDEDYATRRRSGTFGDYREFDRDLSFAPGDFSDDAACGCARARKAVSVDLFDDRVHERVEVFGLRLSRKSGRLSVSSQDVTAKIAEDDAEPALTLGADPGTIAEAGGTSTVTVSTGGGSTFAAAQTIRLDLSGTATRGSDYTIDSTALTLPAGMGEDPSTVSTTVRALDDPFDDDAETVALSATRDGVEFASRAVAIADDDIGSTRVDLAVNPAQVREDAGATTVRVTATLDGAAREEDTALSVTVGSAGDSAVEGTDYETVPDLTLTIDAGETTAETTFRLAPANDSAVEGARTITVDGSALGLAVRSADLTLNDDDVESTTVTLTLDPLEVRENAGSRAVRVTGTLDGGSRPTATVVAVTVGSGGDSAAEGTDYQDVGDLELTIPANRTDGTVTFTLRPANDRTAEGTETISVRGVVAGLAVAPAELAIADDDTASTRLNLSLNPSTVSEAAAPTEVAVTASLDAGARTTDTVVTVTVGAFTDTATQDLDYANVSTLRITVPANETAGQTTFTLRPDNDAIAEGAETISVTGRVRGLSVEPAALTLSDNDTASRVVTLSADPESVSEDTPEDVTVTASLNAGARAEDTQVRLTVGAAGDTAVPGTDYERVSERTLTIPAGETVGTATFLLEPLDNDSADGARTLSVTGSTTVAELRIEPASGAKIALADDDSPAVLVTPDRLTVVEAESGTYMVELQTRPTADVTVTITGVSGDLSLDKTSLVFTGADWSDPQDVEVTAADDDDSARDPDVTLTHRASGAPEYRGLRTELVVTIRENDPSLVFSATSVTVPEGETATYTVALATEPTAEVTVRIAGASGDLSLDKTRLAFTPGDWDDAQTITVEAAEDDDTSTDAAVTLTHEASGGGYDGVVGTVRATIREDDGDPRPPPPPPPGPGPGPSPPPSNRPPVATEEMTARILEVGDTLELDASEHFRDPDRRRMTFEAESADSAVATVEVDGGAVTVRAADHGVTAVTVTAVDDRRARAAQSFEVTVGRLVSFASEEVAAAEGDTATLTVAISRPRDAATALEYVVGPDDDPATADADADDHDGMAGTVVIAAGATEATIAIAVRDDDDIEPPREIFAVTLRRSAEQARDFGLGVAAVRVRIDEGVCDRTPQVRDALRRSLPCAWVSDGDLRGIRTLDLSDAGLVALQPADFSGLDNLRALDMSRNSLASLPDGVFAGLGELSEARSQDNPGSPFVLRVELARTDGPASAPSPARLATRVRQGAPFPMRAGLRAVGGALSSDASVVATGMTESAPILVVREAAAGATRVELASTPSVPDTRCGRFGRYLCYRGFATAIGAPLVLFKDPPAVRGSVPATDLAAENDSIRISLSELFVAVDGRPLRYAARSSDPGLAGAEVRGGVLIVVSGEDGREGTATITVTATDADGLSAELTFEVTLESMPRGFMSGWRRALIEGIIE